MIQQSNLSTTFASGAGSVHAFKISNSAKAFKALSDGIYSDKILAPIRELSTNAYDAHVDKGIADTPIQVTLPTKNNDYMFIVRDFGNGLDHETVCSLYTTYFASTKDDRDDSVGCFGLGSKSPFAYTDSFIVESNQNGQKNLYNCVMSAEGPKLVYVGAVETEDPDGMQISFVVKPGDSYRFRTTAEDFYAYWKTPVNLYIDTALVSTGFDSSDYNLFEVGDCSVYVANSNSACRVVMGNVTYALSDVMLRDTFSIEKQHRDLLNSGTVIYVPIGKFSVTQSRESLEADEVTLLNLQSLVQNLASVVCTTYIEEALAMDWVGRYFLHSRLPVPFKNLLKAHHFEPLLVDIPDEIKSRGYGYVLNSLKISAPVNVDTGLGGVAGMLVSNGRRGKGTSVTLQKMREFKVHELQSVSYVQTIDATSPLNFVVTKKGFSQSRYSFSARTHLKDQLINTLLLEPVATFSVGVDVYSNTGNQWVVLASYAYPLAESLEKARPVIVRSTVKLEPVKRDMRYTSGKKASTNKDGVSSRSVGLWKYSTYKQAVPITREDMPYVVVPDNFFDASQEDTKSNITGAFFTSVHENRGYPFDAVKLSYMTRTNLISTLLGEEGVAFVKESYVSKLPDTWVNSTEKFTNMFEKYVEDYDDHVESTQHFMRALSWEYTKYSLEYNYTNGTLHLCKSIRTMSPIALGILKDKYGVEIAKFLDKANDLRNSIFFDIHKELMDFSTVYDDAISKPTKFKQDFGMLRDLTSEGFEGIYALIVDSLDKPSEEEV